MILPFILRLSLKKYQNKPKNNEIFKNLVLLHKLERIVITVDFESFFTIFFYNFWHKTPDRIYLYLVVFY